MIFLLAKWVHIFIILTTFGLLAFIILEKLNVISTVFEQIRLDKLVIIGFIFFTATLTIFSLFYSIGIICHLIVNLVVILSAFLIFDYWKTLLKKILVTIKEIRISFRKTLFLMSFFLVALWSIQEVWVYDSKFYHLQAIKWIEEYGTVVGLGNLFDRLANNNSNFLVSAYFNNSFFNLPSFDALNSFFFCIMIFSWFQMLSKYRNDFRFIIFNVLIVACLYSYRWGISSPSPDILVAMLSFYLFQTYCETDFSKIQRTEKFNINTL